MESVILNGPDGTELAGRLWEPQSPRALLVLVHGLGEHSGRYLEMAEYLRGDGIAVLGYDQRGHGASPGARGHIDRWEQYREDLESACTHLSRLYSGVPLFVLGHSMGGLVVLEYALHTDAVPRGIIASAPALGTDGVPPVKIALSRVLGVVTPRLQMELGLDVSNLSRDPEVARSYTADPLVHGTGSVRFGVEAMAAQRRVLDGASGFPCPLLLVYGDDDRIASIGAIERFGAAVEQPDMSRVVYPGGRHESHHELQKSEVLSLYSSWILKRV